MPSPALAIGWASHRPMIIGEGSAHVALGGQAARSGLVDRIVMAANIADPIGLCVLARREPDRAREFDAGRRADALRIALAPLANNGRR
jgi:hypothetical protein